MSVQPSASSSVSNPQTHSATDLPDLRAGARLALVGMLVNVVFAALKISAGIFGHAYALIADGIESALDVAGSIVIWGGLRFAARPPDASHPYGHGKAEPLAAIVVSLGVLAAAVGLAVASVREILTPHHAPAAFTLWILLLVVLVKEFLFRRAGRLALAAESTAVKSDAWHHRADAITSLAAFIGISVALVGGRGWESADDFAALFACLVIGYNGIRLLGPALHEILDTAPRGGISEIVRAAARSVPGVIALDKCYVRKMGVRYYVDLHVRVDGAMSVRAGHQLAHRVKDSIRGTDARIADVLVHIEPASSELG